MACLRGVSISVPRSPIVWRNPLPSRSFVARSTTPAASASFLIRVSRLSRSVWPVAPSNACWIDVPSSEKPDSSFSVASRTPRISVSRRHCRLGRGEVPPGHRRPHGQRQLPVLRRGRQRVVGRPRLRPACERRRVEDAERGQESLGLVQIRDTGREHAPLVDEVEHSLRTERRAGARRLLARGGADVGHLVAGRGPHHGLEVVRAHRLGQRW